MYLDHFKFDEPPFSITPDPRFLYLSERYREALAHLLYGAGEAGGFVQLTGEVGTGKTVICRAFLARLPPAVDAALVFNPKVTATELLRKVLAELRVPLPERVDSADGLIDILNDYLLTAHSRGRRTLLLIDEAQELDPAVLEQIRLLTNLETDRHKLLQIFLIGQPELRTLLEQPRLRQVAQRITARCHLSPLTADETRAYIAHRLRVAGAQRRIFTRRALRELAAHSGGIPRRINILCDRALLGAYATGRQTVDAAVVRRAVREVDGRASRRRSTVRPIVLAGAAVALAGFGFGPGGHARVTAALERLEPPLVDPRTLLSPFRSDAASQAAAPPATSAADRTAAPERPALPAHLRLQQLLASVPIDSDVAAERELLGLWGVPPPAGEGDLCETAERKGLRCLSGRGGWDTLRKLDRPAVLRLWIDGVTRHALLTGFSDDRVALRVDGRRHTFTITPLDRFWAVDYRLLWRPPRPGASIIGDASPPWALRWLWRRLGATGPVPTRYSPAIRSAVRAFQQRQGLKPDGLAGPKTLMRLQSVAAAGEGPRLQAAEG